MRGRGLILAGLMAASMSLGLPASSLAQDMAAQSPGGQSPGDPPSRVGRVAEIAGTVSFHTTDESQWQAATLNYPVTSGNSFWTEPRSHAALEVGPSRIYLDSSTELDIGTLNDQGFVASMPQGAVYLQVSDPAGSAPFEIDTPRGQVHINQPGRYEVVAGDADHPTTVTAYDGGAQVTGPGVNLSLGPQQAAAITGQNENDLQVATGQAQQPDDFVQLVQSEEQASQVQPQPDQGTAQYASPEMTGAQDLNQYGTWQSTPDYGQVWYPQVSAGWAPYRYGHWAYVAPWGYTWVDDAPWGFTPFHYGRWVEIRDRWGWVPGERVERPVYAPALVSFFGDLGGVGINVSVGWVPLGPDEVYVPYYHHSPRYAREVNITNVHNETKIVNVVNKTTVINYNNYANRRGATVVNREVMAGSRAVAPAYGKQPHAQEQQQWAHAKPMNQVPFKPQYNANQQHAAGPKFAAQNQHQQFNGQGQKNVGQASNGQTKYAAEPKLPGQQQPSQPQTKTMQKPKNAAPGPYIPPVNNGAVAAKPTWKGNGQPAQTNMPKVAAQPQAPKPTTHKTNNPPIMTGGNPGAPKPNWQNGNPSNVHQPKAPAPNGKAPNGTPPNGTPPNIIYPTGNGNPSSAQYKQQEFKQQPTAKSVQPFTTQSAHHNNNAKPYLQSSQHTAKPQYQQPSARQNKNYPAAKPAQPPVPAKQQPAPNCAPGAAACTK